MVTQLTAQVTTGTIYGRITDPSGGVMPGVVVNAVAAETGIPRTATTDTNGTYRLPANRDRHSAQRLGERAARRQAAAGE